MAVSNNDTELGDQFDELLSGVLKNLTDQFQEMESPVERGRIIINGKRDLMQILVEKTLEYQHVVDPQAEIVLQELATQYESLVDQALSLAEGNDGDGKVDDKDLEIKRLRKQLAKAKAESGKNSDNIALRSKVRDLE